MKNWTQFAAFALAGLMAGTPGDLRAQDLGETLFTVGTTLEDDDSDGQAWSYLLWQSEDLDQLKGRVFAIYSKEGAATSPNPYTYEGTARTRLEPAAVLALVNRGELIGDDRVKLESDINSLFEEIIPDMGLPLEQKIAVVVDGALLDPELYENLIFLSRSHPAISLIIGTGFAAEHPDGQIRTFEVRECPGQTADPDTDCGVVVGRVTVTVGSPLPLPAPGEPVYVPFSDASGDPDPRSHLNVPLRWSTPDPLRERSLLQFGYNIYRMTEEEALDDNFDSTPPDPQLLQALVEDPGHSATRVNTVPVLIDRFLDATEAADTVSDPETFFYIDDNNRFAPGGQPFVNGDTYYFFVTANDILGRDGEVSAGTLVKICDAMPPPQPKKLIVTNHYAFNSATSINTQHFKVEWEAPDLSDRQTPEEIVGYNIYRWLDLEEMNAKDSVPFDPATATEGGLVATVPAGTLSYIDNGPDSPFISMQRLGDGSKIVDQSYASKTYWYTVRSIDGSACDGNLSGNSAPAYGVLRDRIGPPRPDGEILISCYDLRLVAPNEVEDGPVFEDTPEDGKVYLTLECLRLDPGIDWVEFAVYDPQTQIAGTLSGGQRYYPENENLYKLEVKRDQPTQQEPLYIACRVGGYGKVTGWNYLQVPYRDDPFTAFLLYWEASTIENLVSPDVDCDTHQTVDPDGNVNGITLEFDLTTGTEEWKVYRRINDGALTLIAQGLDSALSVLVKIVEDLNLPANDARVCYFVQVYDQHGNPSPMVRIGCVDVTGKESLGTPMLSTPEPIGDESEPKASVFWFCPPYGVEYFDLWISSDGADLPTTIGDAFQASGSDTTADGTSWRVFRTKRVPTQFPGNTPEFTVDVGGLKTGQLYTFKVRAVGFSGSEGPFSNEETFIWNPNASDTVSGPNVPWPSLGLVEPQSSFNAGIKARTVNAAIFDGGAVRIGLLDYAGYELFYTGEEEYEFAYPPGTPDPGTTVYTNDKGTSLLPFVLYRYQVPNDTYPTVSGDVYQVSPMMEKIPATLETFPQIGLVAYVNRDPFVFVAVNTDQAQGNLYDLLMKDTQPVISGARYRYLIVRFDSNTREIAEIIPTNTVDIP